MNLALASCYPEQERKSMIYLVFCSLLKCSRVGLHEQFQAKVSHSDQLRISEIVSGLRIYKPLQYLLGETEFYGMRMEVGPGVLIPRPETEELVHWILTENPGLIHPVILDIGTGSGCIALALARNLPLATVSGIDNSPDALVYANRNKLLNQCKVEFLLADIFDDNNLQPFKADIIISNPPYIPESNMQAMQANVLQHEPHVALFVPDRDPLLYYRRIALKSKEWLVPEGKLYVELHENYGEDILSLFQGNGFQAVELRKDINGKDRMVRAVWEGDHQSPGKNEP